jgi:hypothetical protein
MTNTGVINRCYSTGEVNYTGNETGSNANKIGGFQGSGGAGDFGGGVLNDAKVFNSFWDRDVAGVDLSGNRSRGGITTAQMRSKSQFEFSGWDMETVWNIDDGNGYPYLRALGPHASLAKKAASVSNKSSAASLAPQAKLRGRTLVITAPSLSDMQIRLIDLRGRSVAKFKSVQVGNVSTFSLSRVPSGMYMLEVRSSGRRVISRPLVLR